MLWAVLEQKNYYRNSTLIEDFINLEMISKSFQKIFLAKDVSSYIFEDFSKLYEKIYKNFQLNGELFFEFQEKVVSADQIIYLKFNRIKYKLFNKYPILMKIGELSTFYFFSFSQYILLPFSQNPFFFSFLGSLTHPYPCCFPICQVPS